MTQAQAEQIAILLNGRNLLVIEYTTEMIISKKDEYVFLEEQSDIVACAQAKRVQWYQWEISHVSVGEAQEGKGLGSRILRLAEHKAIQGGAKLLQCTIRTNNQKSQQLFLGKGYNKTTSFYYTGSGNWVHVYQKSVSVLE